MKTQSFEMLLYQKAKLENYLNLLMNLNAHPLTFINLECLVKYLFNDQKMRGINKNRWMSELAYLQDL